MFKGGMHDGFSAQSHKQSPSVEVWMSVHPCPGVYGQVHVSST